MIKRLSIIYVSISVWWAIRTQSINNRVTIWLHEGVIRPLYTWSSSRYAAATSADGDSEQDDRYWGENRSMR